MCRVSRCCCGVPLRLGCMIIACIELVLSLRYIWLMTDHIGYQYGPGAFVAALLFELVVWGLLLFGAISNNQTAVLVHLILLAIVLVMTGIFFVLVVIIMPVACTDLGWTAQCTTAFIVVLLVILVTSALDIYFWIVTLSFYQDLKEGGLPYPT